MKARPEEAAALCIRRQASRFTLSQLFDNELEQMKPRLLVLASTYPRAKGDPEPGFVHELARRLTDRFEVRVIGPHATGAARRERMDGVEVVRFRYAPARLETLVNHGGIVTNLKRNPLKWLLVPAFLIAQTWTIWRATRHWRPDVIHAHWLIPQGFIVALLSRFCQAVPPFLVTSHGADLYALRFWPMPALKRFVARRAAAMTVVSHAMLQALEEQGISAEGVSVQPMGVGLAERYVPDPAIERDHSELLFVGRLVEKKGLAVLLAAMPRILQAHPQVHLTIAGFGPEETTLRAQVQELGLESKVKFLGAVSQDQLPGLYRRAGIFLAPFIQARGGDQEGLGLVTVEAIGCGCPVIVSDLPAVRDVVADPAMRVTPGDPADIVASVNRMLDRPKEVRDEMASELRKVAVENFDWIQRSGAYARLLTVLCRSSGSA